ncbi:hypothetical protein [Streptomyces sp. NPDC050485]|uniref:hypothetical protein n=1 Tax=Streptomyces sp. NPDC050485 TaxID=3365617 RepID=UPI0037B520F4
MTPALGSVRYLGTGCRYCSPYGIDLSAPALLYVLHYRLARAVKVGITGLTTKYDRLGAFERDGWEVFRTAHFETGTQAFTVEQLVLRRLRDDLGIPAYMNAAEMPHGGATETASADRISAPAVWAMVCEEHDRQAEGKPST